MREQRIGLDWIGLDTALDFFFHWFFDVFLIFDTYPLSVLIGSSQYSIQMFPARLSVSEQVLYVVVNRNALGSNISSTK